MTGGELQSLPDDLEQLKQLLIASYQTIARQDERINELDERCGELDERYGELNAEHRRLNQEHEVLQEQLSLALQKLFGRKSEKLGVDEILQSRLFDEAELHASSDEEHEPERTTVAEHSRSRPKRMPLSDLLRREEIILDIPEEEKQCGCGHTMECIGNEPSEKLVVIPMQFYVRRYLRLKYGCRHCEGSGDEEHPAVRIAPPAPQILPKSIASAELAAYVISAKFCDAVPFYRQNKIFARFGIDIPRSTMCDWAIAVALRCEPIVEQFLIQILAGPLVLMDETTTQVMHERGRENTTKSYMWVMRGGDPETPAVVYRYHPSRSKEIPKQYLSEYEGYLQSDGYDGYEEIGRSDRIIHVGCWAHARRYFFEASKVNKKAGAAEEGLSRIRRLYRIESELREQLSENRITREQFVEQRQERTGPVFSSMKPWLEQKQEQVPPSAKLGQAVSYTLGQWEKLIRYPEQWYLTPDTNLVENAIRPFVVGRRNWLLSGSPRGAHASATLYTLIETARANGLEPYRYLAYIFAKVPTAESDEDFARLTPKYLDIDDYSTFLPNPGG